MRARILIVFSILTLLPVVIVGLVSSAVAMSTVRESTFESTAEVARQLAGNLELRMGDASKMLRIADMDAVVRFTNPWRQSEEGTYRAALEILGAFSLLRGAYAFADIVKGVYIIGFNGNAMNELSGRYALPPDYMNSEAIRAALEKPGETVFVSSSRAGFAPEGPAALDVISISRAIVRVATHDILGVVIVNVDRSAIRDLCATARLGDTGGFALLTAAGSRVYPDYQAEIGGAIEAEMFDEVLAFKSGRFISSPLGEPELFVYDTVPGAGWKILGRVRLAELSGATRKIQGITLFAAVSSALLIILLNLFITKALTKPLRSLQAVIARAESGDLGARAALGGSDEVARLAHSFDLLMDRIGILLKEVVREQEELNKMELKALQAQINPHFLYNTLDAIVWMAEAGKKSEIVEITKSLSHFFRISLSKGEDWITVEQETAHVQSYLTIQKMRYRDILGFELDIDESTYGSRILKLLLQPLVENAIYHGVKNKRGGGKVQISIIRRAEGGLALTVRDDGAGMAREKLEEIRRALDGPESTGEAVVGYGLRNIKRRVDLYYAGRARLELDSEPGCWTTVELVVPEREGGST